MKIIIIGFFTGAFCHAVFDTTITTILGVTILTYYSYPIVKRILCPSVDSAKITILNEQFDDL